MSFRLSKHRVISQVINGESLPYQCRLIRFLTGLNVPSRKGSKTTNDKNVIFELMRGACLYIRVLRPRYR